MDEWTRPLRTGLRDLRSPCGRRSTACRSRRTCSAAMPDAWTVNGAEYAVLRLLGKGKGGYSYLVTDGASQYVLKQIHHEPCEYYTFGDKLQSELRDYETLRKLGIPMPRLLAADIPQERILKEYIAGPTGSRSSSKRDGRSPAGLRRCTPCAACCTRPD